MTTGVIQKRRVRWEIAALAGVLAIGAVLYCWSLGDRMLQPYYAAAVHSMLQSPKAFLFAGYDPAGVVSVDKPPMAFWVQAAVAWLFGYHWWLLALVQAAEGVASVLVLHRTVRRWAGERTALLAALLLALSPVTVAIDRDVQPDALLVLLLLLAAYCVTRAVEGGRTGWPAAAGALVGLAFLTKMLAAWVVLPAFALAYLAAPVGRGRKAWQLVLAAAVTFAVSMSWPLLVSLSPDRPFVGSTRTDSIWELIFGYNGFGRVLGNDTGALGVFDLSFGGSPGPLRLFGTLVGGQIAWLLPVALASVLGAAVAWLRTRAGTPSQRAGWLLWGGWLLCYGLVFSFAGGIFHAYYTCALAPGVAASAAAGLTTLWRWYRAGERAGLLLSVAIAGTAVLAFVLLEQTPDWLPWLRFAILIVGVLAAVGALPRLAPAPVALAGALTMITGPLAFAVATAGSHPDVVAAGDPSAGPSTSDGIATVRAALGGTADAARAYVRFMDAAPELSAGQRQVLAYVTARDPNAPITLAVEGGTYGADPYLVNTGARVAALGGYLGLDPAPTAARLAAWVHAGRVRFVLLPEVFLHFGQQTGTRNSGAQISARVGWVNRTCAKVPPAVIGPDAASAGLLFDCG
ncbi:MAG TPA: glycosyltransferase family 39 protein [Amycolatopsis sp.]|uniref:ArnT family glycosyltransferase n=1 Tax=Amycolatopsis sp. TaxID=37632 RepID=UPI002B49846D|nr:glycosyltransferase family 39 protein [Amycolatopsis sp.]HKS46943.1 glycosyltransferase family 39 protein [Amycolatopsis sp.]